MKRISDLGINYLDIMLAVSFVGVVMGVSAPLIMKQKGPDGLRHATDMISSSVLLTRQKAVAGNTNYRIRYDYDERAFRIFRQEIRGEWQLDPPENRSILPRGVTVSTSSTPVDGILTIKSSGEIDELQSPVLLHLQDRGGNRCTIRISADGRVQQFHEW